MVFSFVRADLRIESGAVDYAVCKGSRSFPSTAAVPEANCLGDTLTHSPYLEADRHPLSQTGDILS